MSQKPRAALHLPVNDHTHRACAAAQRDYLEYIGDSKKSDLSGWISNMRSRGLAVNTIRQRVSLVRKWLDIPEDVALPSRSNLHTSTWLTREQLQALLAIIPKNKGGRNDFALIAVLLVTGFKLQKVRALRWKDLHEDATRLTISANRLPQLLINAIAVIDLGTQDSYSATVCISDAKKSEYIFTAFCPRSPRARSRQFSISGKKEPLSTQEINRRIKRYARLAGLEPEWISSETLRRTRTELGETAIIGLVEEAYKSRHTGPVRWKRVEKDKRLHGIGRRRG